MNGLGRMHEEGGSAGGSEGRADVFADDPGLADADGHDAPVGGGDELDGVDEVLVEVLDEAEDGRRLDFENALGLGDCRVGHGARWYYRPRARRSCGKSR